MEQVILPSSMKDIGGSGIDLTELTDTDQLVGYVDNLTKTLGGTNDDFYESYIKFKKEVDDSEISVIDPNTILNYTSINNDNFAEEKNNIDLFPENKFRWIDNNDSFNRDVYIDINESIDGQTSYSDGHIKYIEGDNEISLDPNYALYND